MGMVGNLDFQDEKTGVIVNCSFKNDVFCIIFVGGKIINGIAKVRFHKRSPVVNDLLRSGSSYTGYESLGGNMIFGAFEKFSFWLNKNTQVAFPKEKFINFLKNAKNSN